MNEINFNIEDIEKIDLSMDVGIKKIYPPLENLTVEPTKEQQVFNHENSYGYDKVIVGPIPNISLQDKTVTPTKEIQTITSDEEYDGLNEITVNAIPDEYIIPDGTLEVAENGDIDVTTFKTARIGVYVPPKLQDKEVTPTKEIQNISFDEEYDGLNNVQVNAIPDEYIVPTGTLEITENGEHNVSEYEKVITNIEGSGGSSNKGQVYKVGHVISAGTSTGTGTTPVYPPQMIQNTNTSANLVLWYGFVRSDEFTLSDHITILAVKPTDYNDGQILNQKLFVGYSTSLKEAHLTQTDNARWALGCITFNNADIPILVDDGIKGVISGRINITTDNDYNVYLLSQIYGGELSAPNFNEWSYGSWRASHYISTYASDDKYIDSGTNNSYSCILHVKIPSLK